RSTVTAEVVAEPLPPLPLGWCFPLGREDGDRVDVARVVLALEEHDVAEEIMHFLDRTGRARVVATASDGRQLAEAVRQLEPDAVVAQPSLLGSGAANGERVIAIATTESARG